VWKRKIDFSNSVYAERTASTTLTLRDGSFLILLADYWMVGDGQSGGSVLIKIDGDGNLVWGKKMAIKQSIFPDNTSFSLSGSSIMEAENGDIFTVFNINSFYFPQYLSTGFFTLTHLNANGEVIWDKSFLSNHENNTNLFQLSSYAGVHESGDSLIITGTYINGSLYPADENLFFAMKMDKLTGSIAKPIAYERTADYNHGSRRIFYPASFKINNDGVCLVDGGYDDWLPPNRENMRRQLFDFLYFDNSLTLKKASQLNIPGFDMPPIYSSNGKDDILLINRDGTNFVISTFNVSKNNIVQQRKFQTQRYMVAASQQPYAINTADKAVSITTQFTNNENNEGIDVIRYYNDDFIWNPSCFGIDTTCASKIDYLPARVDFSWPKIMTNILAEGTLNISLGDIDITTEDVCSTTSTCNSLKIIGPDTICNYGQEIKYTARLNGECFKKVSWKAVDINSFDNSLVLKTTNDTTCNIFCRTNEIQDPYIKLYAYVENCDNLIDSMLIKIAPVPTPDTVRLKFCSKLNLLFAGWGYKNYVWDDGSIEYTREIAQPGIYSVNFTYCNSKQGTKIFDISYTPDHFFDKKQITQCNGDSVLITLANTYDYSWLTNYNLQQIANNSAKLFPQKDTVYVVRAQVSDICYLNDSLRIKVINTRPIFLGNDTSICQNTSITLQAPQGFERYVWNDDFSGATRTITKKGSYSVTAFDNNGCYSKDTFTLKNVFPLPDLHLPKTDILCKDQNNTLDAGDFKTFQWQDGSMSRYFNVSNAGKYFVTVTDENKCTNADTIVVKAIVDTPANFIITDTAICKYSDILLRPFADNFDSYLWSNKSPQKFISVNSPGIYSLEVTDKNGCKGLEQIQVIEKNCLNKMIFPSAFSPNNDGNNDVFKPFVSGKLLYYKLSVFNRLGNKVFDSMDFTRGWRGDKIAGTYIWVCEYQFADEARTMQKGYVSEVITE
jgi:hypothetical protein